MTTAYRRGWLAGLRFACDALRVAAARDDVTPDATATLIDVSEGLAVGASMRELEWERGE